MKNKIVTNIMVAAGITSAAIVTICAIRGNNSDTTDAQKDRKQEIYENLREMGMSPDIYGYGWGK